MNEKKNILMSQKGIGIRKCIIKNSFHEYFIFLFQRQEFQVEKNLDWMFQEVNNSLPLASMSVVHREEGKREKKEKSSFEK